MCSAFSSLADMFLAAPDNNKFRSEVTISSTALGGRHVSWLQHFHRHRFQPVAAPARRAPSQACTAWPRRPPAIPRSHVREHNRKGLPASHCRRRYFGSGSGAFHATVQDVSSVTRMAVVHDAPEAIATVGDGPQPVDSSETMPADQPRTRRNHIGGLHEGPARTLRFQTRRSPIPEPNFQWVPAAPDVPDTVHPTGPDTGGQHSAARAGPARSTGATRTARPAPERSAEITT
jgi:hypothetical protein